MYERILKLIIFTLAIILTMTTIGCKKHKRLKKQVKFYDGSIVTFNFHKSENVGFIIRDVLSVGGGNEWREIRFSYKEKDYLWESKSRTFILNAYKNTLYTMIFDTETDRGKICFRFYKYKTKWIEIPAKEFPKEISVENMMLSEDDKDDLKGLNPDYYPFRRTLTAKLWLRLEKGIKYYEAPDVVDYDFLKEYKKKYFSKKK